MRKSSTQVYIDDRRVNGRVPKRYMGPVRIESTVNVEARPVQFPCPFCMTPLNITGDCACPDCESGYSFESIGEQVVIVTARNASNPTI